MEKTKYYNNVKFPVSTIREAYNKFIGLLSNIEPKGKPSTLIVTADDESWDFDNIEEFYAAYLDCDTFQYYHYAQNKRFSIKGISSGDVIISIAHSEKAAIESVFNIFERDLDSSTFSTEDEEITIFIGHGNNQDWRDLKDHLHEKHGFNVITYEIGPRAGTSVKDVLEEMLDESSMAFLVMTAEDIKNDGEVHARENVIHEIGLFQGHLGFERAIILLEDGVKEFSNILGVNQIRFDKGRIRETFGEVLATIKREFESE
jgi:predicted nucleotide-binding protein